MQKKTAQSRKAAKAGTVEEKPVALTLKIGQKMYERLSALRAKERRTAQDILTDALQEYLRRSGV